MTDDQPYPALIDLAPDTDELLLIDQIDEEGFVLCQGSWDDGPDEQHIDAYLPQYLEWWNTEGRAAYERNRHDPALARRDTHIDGVVLTWEQLDQLAHAFNYTKLPIPPEPYRDAFLWRAIYDPEGNDVLDEHEEDGTPHTFAEVDQDRLLAFMLIPQWEGLAPHAVHLEPWQRLIWWRKTNIDANGPRAGQIRKAHVIGWQATVNGTNVKSMTAAFDNGATLTCSDESLIEP